MGWQEGKLLNTSSKITILGVFTSSLPPEERTKPFAILLFQSLSEREVMRVLK